MDIGLVGRFGDSPSRDFGYVRDLAQSLEGAGFASLWAPEHVVFFGAYRSKYPYTPDGVPPWPPDTGIFDPLMVCAAAALATTSLRVGTAVLILPQRPALLTAKEALTVDHLSAGRLWLGVGAGWSAEEYQALGLSFARRGHRFDEHIEAMRAAWTMDRASYSGEFVSFEDVVLLPEPVTPGGPKVLVGGDSAPAMRRAARLGNGWYGWWADYELEPHLARLHGVLAAHGRTPGEDFHVKLGLPLAPGDGPEEVARKAEHAAGLGVEELVVGAPVSARNIDADVTRWADTLGLSRR